MKFTEIAPKTRKKQWFLRFKRKKTSSDDIFFFSFLAACGFWRIFHWAVLLCCWLNGWIKTDGKVCQSRSHLEICGNVWRIATSQWIALRGSNGSWQIPPSRISACPCSLTTRTSPDHIKYLYDIWHKAGIERGGVFGRVIQALPWAVWGHSNTWLDCWPGFALIQDPGVSAICTLASMHTLYTLCHEAPSGMQLLLLWRQHAPLSMYPDLWLWPVPS